MTYNMLESAQALVRSIIVEWSYQLVQGHRQNGDASHQEHLQICDKTIEALADDAAIITVAFSLLDYQYGDS